MSSVSRRLLALGMLAFFTAGTVFGQELYVRNRPFKGEVSGRGAGMFVELEPLAKMLEATIHTGENGAKLMTLSVESQVVEGEPGAVLVEGKPVSTMQGSTGVLVNLKEVAAALEARLNVNAELGTIDFNLPVARVAAPAPTAAQSAPTGPMEPIVAKQQGGIGGAVNLDSELVAGRKNIVYFYADW